MHDSPLITFKASAVQHVHELLVQEEERGQFIHDYWNMQFDWITYKTHTRKSAGSKGSQTIVLLPTICIPWGTSFESSQAWAATLEKDKEPELQGSPGDSEAL